ncbi:MAG: hypothetical protein COA36_16830 [Desulfotalea sp.]|nr:MAG: hypothetical protein COA36_16830 [Desulfotalea sp.]
MKTAEEILRNELKIDKAIGPNRLIWELHKRTLIKCMDIYKNQFKTGRMTRVRKFIRYAIIVFMIINVGRMIGYYECLESLKQSKGRCLVFNGVKLVGDEQLLPIHRLEKKYCNKYR